MDLKKYIDRVDNFPKEGIIFRDITPLMANGEAYKYATDQMVDFAKECGTDLIVGPEARGLIIGATVANKLGLGFIPVRKAGKLPPSTVEMKFEYEKEYGKDVLELPKLVNQEYKGKSFYIVDDIYATGNTMKAIRKAIEDAGGIIKGQGVIMNIKELNNDTDIYSLLDINEE